MFFQFPYLSLRPKRGDFYFQKALFVLFLLLSFSVQAQPKAELRVDKKSFGSVQRGEVVVLTYTVSNSGNEALLLLNSEVACSCTSVVLDQAPIPPGGSGLVKVSFDTKSVWGRQDRIVTVFTNTADKSFRLRFKGQVSKH